MPPEKANWEGANLPSISLRLQSQQLLGFFAELLAHELGLGELM